MKYFCGVLFVLVVLFAKNQVIGKRSGNSGRTTARRTTPRTNNYHQTTYHQANNYQPPVTPSAPVLPQQSNPSAPIGFENANRQSSSPVGFENVHNRPPQGNNQPPTNIGFNTQHQQGGGYNPQAPQTQFGGYNSQPPQTQFGGYNPQAPQTHFGGNSPSGTWNHPNPYGNYAPHGGYSNPSLAQPGSYYNNFATPGVQPQFFQPAQQSSGFGAGSLLGIAGSFGGGYLLGRLTSGGGDHKDGGDKNQQQQQQQQPFIVHHYYQNSQEIPKQMTVSNESLATCNQSITQSLCVPNTFPMCFTNGTIMCVTHTQFTVPCGNNNALACIVTALPCNNAKDKNCNSGTNFSTSTILVPCISNVTLAGQNTALPGSNELCITAIAEPAKKLESAVPSLVNLMTMIATLPFQFQAMMNDTTTVTPIMTMPPEIKTEMPGSIVRDG